ncbi:hypothetical protein [Atopomonas sediminilitoris]|uniref:hypothetical protein n=1 Tax=Atopomonas sediminilitoris TaxID=2919919 RepID=UPI001F4DE43E|nr:hypothetical protein [Atopomonas sediminilitoris]MCJ8169134.1 hypothetical protein [Atopomonas sediminilitoris]
MSHLAIAPWLARLLCACALPNLSWAADMEAQHELGFEHTAFGQAGAQGQSRQHLSVSVKSEFWAELNDNNSLTVTPFARWDEQDSRRSHADLREAFWLHLGDGFELRTGIRQVFWGVTEGRHLVDIINQTDLIERLDGEAKLGQPMVNLAFEHEAQQVDLFVLPGFRKRTFAGEEGRLRLPLIVDNDAAYEASNGERHVDLAARWQYNGDALRLGLSGFHGTNREAELRLTLDPNQLRYSGGQAIGLAAGYQPQLSAYYRQITQWGLDAQLTQGDLLWKLEAIQQSGGAERHHAADAGFEYTQVGWLDSNADAGWLVEYLYDSRGERATSAFEHDWLLGWRLSLNDAASSTLLASVIIDSQHDEQLLSVEGQRRLSDSLLLELELRAFLSPKPVPSAWEFISQPDLEHKLRPLVDDDYLRLSLRYFL